MILFRVDLAEEDLTLIAGAVVFVSLKTVEQTDKTINPDYFLTIIVVLLKISEEEMI